MIILKLYPNFKLAKEVFSKTANLLKNKKLNSKINHYELVIKLLINNSEISVYYRSLNQDLSYFKSIRIDYYHCDFIKDSLNMSEQTLEILNYLDSRVNRKFINNILDNN